MDIWHRESWNTGKNYWRRGFPNLIGERRFLGEWRTVVLYTWEDGGILMEHGIISWGNVWIVCSVKMIMKLLWLLSLLTWIYFLLNMFHFLIIVGFLLIQWSFKTRNEQFISDFRKTSILFFTFQSFVIMNRSVFPAVGDLKFRIPNKLSWSELIYQDVAIGDNEFGNVGRIIWILNKHI